MQVTDPKGDHEQHVEELDHRHQWADKNIVLVLTRQVRALATPCQRTDLHAEEAHRARAQSWSRRSAEQAGGMNYIQ